jgi:hydroxyacylglutathione hydrolase
MIQCTQLTLGELDTHCYLVWCDQTLECLIIDPGATGEYISETILRLQLKPLAILLTHGHFDHCLGALEVKLNFSLPLLLHQKDLFLLRLAQKSAEHWLKHSVDPIPDPDGFLDPSSILSFGEERLIVIETPGHTPGSICFLHEPTPANKDAFMFAQPPLLFSGDTLFKDSVGSTNHRYSNVLSLSKSIEKLKKLPAETVVYPGHGASTTIGEEGGLQIAR